jgi:hypothetical protein
VEVSNHSEKTRDMQEKEQIPVPTAPVVPHDPGDVQKPKKGSVRRRFQKMLQ